MPSFIQSAAELRGFKSICRPPISYVGYNRARMVHFAFELRWCPGELRGFSPQDDRDLIDLPFLRCEDGQLGLGDQYPGSDPEHFEQSLSFLPNSTRACILSTAVIPRTRSR